MRDPAHSVYGGLDRHAVHGGVDHHQYPNKSYQYSVNGAGFSEEPGGSVAAPPSPVGLAPVAPARVQVAAEVRHPTARALQFSMSTLPVSEPAPWGTNLLTTSPSPGFSSVRKHTSLHRFPSGRKGIANDKCSNSQHFRLSRGMPI